MSRLERWTVWASTAAASLTGFLYAWMKYVMRPLDEFAVINHPLQPLVLKLHILASPVLVFAIGLIAARHIIPHLRSGVRRARGSGLTSALVVTPMILTGYLIQAVTNVPLLAALAWSHLGLGTVFALAAAVHAAVTRARRSNQPQSAVSPWPAKSPRASGHELRSKASQAVLDKG